MSAACPPMFTRIGEISGVENGVEITNAPSGTRGDTRPSPVPKRETTEPRGAGLAGPLTVPSWFRIAPWPVPLESAEHRPIADGVTVALNTADRRPSTSTTMLTPVDATLYGTNTLI